MIEPRDLQLVSTLLTFAANAALAVIVVLALAARLSPRGAELRDRARAAVQPNALWLAWLVATVATLGSLYFSEVANYIPCTLCWYQRVAMYPLAVILAIAAVRRDWRVRVYAWPMVGIGAAISAYHYLVERYPSLEAADACSALVPCTEPWFEQFGFVTLAYMALSGFALIAALLAWARPTGGAGDAIGVDTTRADRPAAARTDDLAGATPGTP